MKDVTIMHHGQLCRTVAVVLLLGTQSQQMITTENIILILRRDEDMHRHIMIACINDFVGS